jgi:TatA/E family protein of Tat protein translocase
MEGLLWPAHLIFISGIVLLIFVPKKLPDLGHSFGKGIREFKDAVRHFRVISSSRRDLPQPRALIQTATSYWEAQAIYVAAKLGVAYSVLLDEKGMLKEGYADDGLHPNAKGYALVAPVAKAAIKKRWGRFESLGDRAIGSGWPSEACKWH